MAKIKVKYRQLNINNKIDLFDKDYKYIKTVEPLKCQICGSLCLADTDICSKKCATIWVNKYIP